MRGGRLGRRAGFSAATLAALAAAILFSSRAEAQVRPAFTLERASGALGVRYGSNDMNLGLGALAGYTLPQSICLGADFD